jgi:Calcineurin-like phosphoesterase
VSRDNRRCRLGTLLLLTACAGVPPVTPPVPILPPEQVETSLYLIGDAGAPNPEGEPVLRALTEDLNSRTASTRVVLFLGDNAYPSGLPAPGGAGRQKAEQSLLKQVQVVTNAGATGYFVLGNHDWAKYGKTGWDAALRQEAFLDSAGHGAVSMRPGGGCPGPSVVNVGRLRLVLLDTQWWLHGGPKPTDPTSTCATDSEAEVVSALESALSGAVGQLAIVAGHHPIVSGGVHGGHFGWKDHLFPLRNIEPWLWVPLPLIGSLYPAIRSRGASRQDMSSGTYQRLIRAFRKVFADHPPALYAAGHEHNLQVIKGRGVPLELVSGAGIYGHYSRATTIRGSEFAKKASGFARLDVPRAGPARLAVLEVDRRGNSREVFSTQVE